MMARKLARRVSDRDMIEALQLSGGMPTLAAKRLECHFSTVYERMKKVPAVAKAAEYVRELRKDVCECVLFSKVLQGNMAAVCFFAKCQMKDRGYVEMVRSELTGADGGPLQLQAVKNAEELSDDELAAIAAGEARKPAKRIVEVKEPDRPGDPIQEIEAAPELPLFPPSENAQ
jgi:hypothetical protein